MALHLVPHNLTPEELGRRDAEQAHHGCAVSNPFPLCHPDHSAWQSAYNSEALRLFHADLVLEAA
jgi:hypothetical protein